MDKRALGVFAAAIVIALAMGGASALLTMNGMEHFEDVAQSRLTPPDWVFPIVWTALYTLMGAGAARICLKPPGSDRSRALTLYAYQLIVNFFWSLFFFNMRGFALSLAWILLLWVLIARMIRAFRRVDSVAAWLQIPYFLWVSFAVYLTCAVWRLNP